MKLLTLNETHRTKMMTSGFRFRSLILFLGYFILELLLLVAITDTGTRSFATFAPRRKTMNHEEFLPQAKIVTSEVTLVDAICPEEENQRPWRVLTSGYNCQRISFGGWCQNVRCLGEKKIMNHRAQPEARPQCSGVWPAGARG